MYESVLKTASDNTDFTFTTVNAPLPVFDVFTQRQDAGGALDFAFMSALAFAMIPTTMIAFILNERELQLKHIQLISGMNLPAYWLANGSADVIKAYVPVLLTMLIAVIFSVSYSGVPIIMLMFPFAIVPMTYTTSFLFGTDTQA
jgi:ATP-binding cassette subfamily A (ABC1) protein 3